MVPVNVTWFGLPHALKSATASTVRSVTRATGGSTIGTSIQVPGCIDHIVSHPAKAVVCLQRVADIPPGGVDGAAFDFGLCIGQQGTDSFPFLPWPETTVDPQISFGQTTGTSGVEVGVGNGVSVGRGVRVDMANVGSGEGSITGAGGGATSDQLQASAARIKVKRGRVHPSFMIPPI